MSQREFFAFNLNEYHYRRVYFKRFLKRYNAEKWAHIPYRGTAQSDFDPTIIEGREALEKWAKECNYEIDWSKKLLTYKGD